MKDYEFKHEYNGMGLISTIGLNCNGEKTDNVSTITLDVESMGGYPFSLAYRRADAGAEVVVEPDVSQLEIVLNGRYESEDLLMFFQEVGNLSKLIFGAKGE